MGSSISGSYSGSYSVVSAVVFCVLRLVVFSVSRLVETDVLCDGGGSEGAAQLIFLLLVKKIFPF